MEFSQKESNKVKGIAILMLLFHHQFAGLHVYQDYNIVSLLDVKLIQQIATHCRECVWIFSFISAYGIAVKYSKMDFTTKNVMLTIKKRWFSLMIPYWLVFITIIFIRFLLHKNPMSIYNEWIEVVIDFFALPDIFGTTTQSGVFWYMGLAQMIILFSPIIYKLVVLLDWLSIPIVSIGMLYLNSGVISEFGGIYIHYLMAVVIGMLSAQKKVYEKITKNINKYSALKVLLLLLFIVVSFIIRYKIKFVQENIDLTLFICILNGFIPAMIGLLVMHFKGRFGDVLSILGCYSGLMYLIHIFVLEFIGRRIYELKYILLSYLIFLFITFAISIVYKLLVKYAIKAFEYIYRLKNRISV